MTKIALMSAMFLCLILPYDTSMGEAKDFGKFNRNIVVSLIQELNPKVKLQEANRIADALIEVSMEESCNIPWVILLGVAYKESNLDSRAFNKKSKDRGIMQINEKTIRRLDLDRKRLKQDVKYNISVGCYLISDNKKRFSKRTVHWLGIYNAGTALWKVNIRNKVKRYDKDLQTKIKMIKLKIKERATLANNKKQNEQG